MPDFHLISPILEIPKNSSTAAFPNLGEISHWGKFQATMEEIIALPTSNKKKSQMDFIMSERKREWQLYS